MLSLEDKVVGGREAGSGLTFKERDERIHMTSLDKA